MMATFRRGRSWGLPDRDLDRLVERYGALLVVRVGIAGTVVVVAAFARSVIGIGGAVVAPLTLAYLGFAVLAEVVRRRGRRLRLDIQAIMQLVDVAYIALIMAPTGGPRSLLVFLLYIHLIAVTLVGSPRTGFRLALVDSLVFILLYTFSVNARVSELLGTQIAAANEPSTSAVVLSVLAFWLIAGSTAFYSWVNERELRNSKRELEGLARMSLALEGARDAGEIMQVLLATSLEAFQFPRGTALLPLPGGRTATWTVYNARPPGPPQPMEVAQVGADLVVQQSWAERAPRLVRSFDPDTNSMLDRLLPHARNVVVLPLTAEGDPIGALAVERGGPFGVKLPVRAVTMLNQFAANAALAVRNARLMAEVERLANEDDLTGLANHRVFEEVLVREVARTRRSLEPLGLIVIDIDHFKRINDTYGHPAGNEVLRGLAGVLSGLARDIDLVARYGGEEFTVILPNCSLDDALGVAERMRLAVADDPNLSGVTVSAGVASIPANAADGESLVAAADEAMYCSKRAGRNQTTTSKRQGPTVRAYSR